MTDPVPSNVLAIALERVAEYRKTRGQISMPYQAYMIALADEIEAARITAEYWKAEHLAGNAEIERLRTALATANANHERFEREWYLRGDELERLREDLRRTESARVALRAENEHYKQRVAELTDALKQREDQLRIALDLDRAAQPPGDG